MPQPAKEARKYDVGELVMAKWPKSNLFFRGEIIDYNDIDYLIRFEDEGASELAIKYRDVSLPFEKRMSRSRSRGRTPTRKSSGKSPGRKSPSRKTASSPNKKSPSRTTRTSRSTDTSASRKSLGDKKSESNISPPSLRGRPPTRHSLRIANFEKTKDTTSNNIKVNVRAITKAFEARGSIVGYTKRAAKYVWSTLKVFPAIAFAFGIPFILNQMCTKNKCTILDVPDIPRKLQYYYDQKALMVTAGYFATMLLLSFIPVGKVVRARNGANFRCNGFVSLLLSLAIIPVMLKFEYNIVALYNLYRHFMVSCLAMSLVLSVLLYFKSYYARRDTLNPKGKSGYFLPDLVAGRELYPRIGNIDIKLYLFRSILILTVIINVIVVIKDLQARLGGYSPTLLVACALQIFYIIDLIWFEDHLFTTYEYLRTGTGLFFTASCFGAPFIMTIWTRYVFNHRTELPWYCLVGAASLNLIGYIILRGSNSQKHAFRTSPSDPALAHLESIPTSAGQRLLVSGWWGVIRHPNYLGDILTQLSWTLICGFHHAIPWVVFGISTIYLIVRTYLVERECKKKYGLAWNSYTSRVKHRLIPKVF